MKNCSKRILTLLMLFAVVMVFSMLPVTASVVITPQVYTTADDSVEVETKFKKVSTNRVTFNANGGRIGSKKTQITNVRKGSAIKKFPSTPKRTGYTFKGWYTKKSSGKKIAVSFKPTKSITLYAQWTKKVKSRVLTAEEKKFVGRYTRGAYSSGYWTYHNHDTDKWSDASGYAEGKEFKSDGTYGSYFWWSNSWGSGYYYDTGKWHISPKGSLHITNIMRKDYNAFYVYTGTRRMDDASYKYVFTQQQGKKGIDLIYKNFSPDFYEKR